MKPNAAVEEKQVQLPLVLPCLAQGQEDLLNWRGGISRADLYFPSQPLSELS